MRIRPESLLPAIFLLGLATGPSVQAEGGHDRFDGSGGFARSVLSPTAWPHVPTANVALCMANGNQSAQVAIPDGAGGAITVWEDTRNGHVDIFAQRVDAGGTVLWTEDGVAVCTSLGNQSAPAIASDGAGGVIAVWADTRSGAYDIYAQRLDASGTPLWTSQGVPVCAAGSDQYHAALAADGAGGAIIAWTDGRGSPFDIYAQRVNSAGSGQWTGNGVPVCTAGNTQQVPQLVSDGANGAIMAWTDLRDFDQDIYVQRVNSAGSPQWTGNGVLACNALNDQYDLRVVPDDLGGAILVWMDERNGSSNSDLYAQRVNILGSMRWPANGLAVCSVSGNPANARVISDGVGGAIVVWQDPRNGPFDIYGQRVTGDGNRPWSSVFSPGFGLALATGLVDETTPNLAPDGTGGAIVAWQDYRSANSDIYAKRVDPAGYMTWASGLGAVCTEPSSQAVPVMVTDGDGGSIVIWQDPRNGTLDLYSQRIERFGYLGNPEPTIQSIQDIPNDEGSLVSIAFGASYLEAQIPGVVDEYVIWRSVPSVVAPLGSLSAYPGLTDDPDEAIRTGRLLRTTSAGGNYAWEYVGVRIADASGTYQFTGPTAVDSTDGSNPETAFMIQARPSGSPRTPYFFSAPATGYSVDNLAPGAPTGFAGLYGPGAVELRWHPNPEPDIAEYRIYRGIAPDFPPGPGSFFIAQSDTDYVGPADLSYVYKLTAVDIHGNESPVATVVPWQTGVDKPLPAGLLLGSPTPNPARGSSTISWSLPETGRVRIELFDVNGRRVSLLQDGMADAGPHVLGIPLRDDAGRSLASGLYFLRLDWNGQAGTRRIAVVH